VRFTVLGTLQVMVEGNLASLRPKERVVLATLLLEAGQVVSVPVLASAIWGDEPPSSTRNTIQGQVKRLRQALGPQAARIVTRSPGYLIEVRPGELDLSDFSALRERALEAATAGEWNQAAKLLREALALWDGEPLSGVPSAYLQRTEVPRLAELRHEALSARIDADLRLGRHGAVTAELRGLVARYPFRERLWEQLMLALYRDGRQRDALAAYQQARQSLRGELGIDPGPGLRGLHDQVLAADPALAASTSVTALADPVQPERPRQLPADLPDFTGRDGEARLLRDLLAGPGSGQPGRVAIASVAGPGGIGKTSLAIHVAHQVAEQFPDGQLFVSLGGAASPASPADVLARLLRDLGMAQGSIPAAADERAARYRTAIAGRKMLILLDDAHGSAQVRPLLPGTGDSAVLITSRSALAGITGSAFTGLSVLSAASSRALFTAIVGERRAADDPHATDAVVQACAGLPLAIRIAASRLAIHPGWTTGQLSELLGSEHRRLEELAADDMAVRATFEISYLALPPGQPDPARAFRLFGLAGMRTLAVQALAALCGAPVADTPRAVAALLEGHLLQAHDLLCLYATERAEADETDASRRDALHRLLTWYQHTLNACVRELGNAKVPVPLEPLEPAVPEPCVGNLAEAVTWLQAEQANLARTVAIAFAHGLHELCWQLAWLLRYYFDRYGRWAESAKVLATGLNAAEITGNKAAIAGLLNGIGSARWRLGELQSATESYERALAVRRELGDDKGAATVLSNLGLVDIDAGKNTSAIRRFTEALRVNRQLEYPFGEAQNLTNLGYASEKAGYLDEALRYYQRGLDIRVEHCSLNDQAASLHSIGALLIIMGRVQDAMDHLGRGLRICQDNHARYGEGVTLMSIGDGHQALGKQAEARQAWQRAQEILADLGVSEADDARHRLARG
jgi:DNA-binding SARP family transcriptional activator/Flp pilus assembly protein TadD